MNRYNAKLVYPHERFRIILQNSETIDEFYGMDELESKKLKIIQAKYGCRHCFHTLPDNVSLNLHKFIWNEECQCFQIDADRKVSVQLNLLEENIVEYVPDSQEYFY
jgi:hypothetical protein